LSPDVESIRRLLAAAAPFSALPAEERIALAHSPRVSLARDELLFSAGDRAEAVYLVLSGEIALEIDGADGKSICVSSVKAGGVFGELAVLDGKPRSVGARAAGPALLLSVKAASFMALLRAHPDFSLALLKDLAAKVRSTNGQVSGLSFQSLRGRVAGLIVSLAGDGAFSATSLAMTQHELAGRLGASREKVNGHLQAMQNAGAIKLARGMIEILNRAALKRFSEAENG
jgi:CRP-like cAMP-binding protein